MSMTKRTLLFCTILLLATGISAKADVPNSTVIHGQLLDDAGVPLTGERNYEISFYDAQTDGNLLDSPLTGVAQLSQEGLFNISVILSEAAKTVPALWYEIAIDSDTPPDGLDGDDLFPNRIQVESVPFALQAATVESIPLLEGVTTPVQEQLDAKADALDVYTKGDINTQQDAQDAAIALKADGATLADHIGNMSNPHAVTAALVGLGNVDNTADVDKPVSIATQALLDSKLGTANDAYIIVETTSNPVTNGANLLAAYAAATALTPNGSALSATNRAVVIVPPGNYDLGESTFALDTDFVDLAGLTTARESQCIYRNGHVLTQTAADVHIENLLFYFIGNSMDIFAYYPIVTWTEGVNEHTGSSPATIIRNCEFRQDYNNRSMRHDTEYAGTYENVLANGINCFGGYENGMATGTFINCDAGWVSFGGYQGVASGTFINCSGGDYSFGGLGVASGTFINCTGIDFCFGFAGVASGTFNNCTAGSGGYGGGIDGDASNGKFYFCVGGNSAFTENGLPAPVHLFCIQNGVQYAGNE